MSFSKYMSQIRFKILLQNQAHFVKKLNVPCRLFNWKSHQKIYKSFSVKSKYTPRFIHLSQRRLLHPWLMLLYKAKAMKLMKGASMLVGRTGRKVYDKLPISIKEQITRTRIVGFSCFGISGVIAYYSYMHYDTCPITGRKRWISFTKEQILTLAEIDHVKLLKTYQDNFISNEDPFFKMCNGLVSTLVEQNSDNELVTKIKWNLNIVNDDNVVNAFVLPNGEIYLFTGMVKLMHDWNELAIVLSHEMAHTILGHVQAFCRPSGNKVVQVKTKELAALSETFVYRYCLLAQPKDVWHTGTVLILGLPIGISFQEQQSFILFKDLVVYAGLAFLWFVFDDLFAFVGSWIENFLSPLVFELGFNLPYNRLLETEADEVGLNISTKACFDPRWAVLLWDKMALKDAFDNLQEAENEFLFLSSHPSNKERAAALEKKLPEMFSTREILGCPSLPPNDPLQKAHTLRKISANIREQMSLKSKIQELQSAVDDSDESGSDVGDLLKMEKRLKKLISDYDAILKKENVSISFTPNTIAYETSAKLIMPNKKSEFTLDATGPWQAFRGDLWPIELQRSKKMQFRDYYRLDF